MQNSRVIRRANAGLSRCLSQHRRLCREIDELDRLLFHDEFLRDPRTLWLLQNSQREALKVDPGPSEPQFRCSQNGIRSRGPPSQELLGSSGSSADSEECYQGRRMYSAYRSPAPTPQPSPARRSRARVGLTLPRPVRKMVLEKKRKSQGLSLSPRTARQ